MDSRIDADVVVIGAGLSGLCAAHVVRETGLSVRVLEARSRVGGLTYSPQSRSHVSRLDLGGQWVSPRHSRMNALISRYRIPLVKQFDQGNRACIHGSQTFFGPMGTVPGLTPEEQAQYEEAYRRLYEAMDVIAANAWESPDAVRLDSMTYASWVNSICAPGRVHAAMSRIPGAYYGALPEEISALELFQKLKSCGGPLFMSDTREGGQSFHMMGSAEVSEALARDLAGDVHLSSPVRQIEWTSTGVAVRTDAGSHHARYAVLALPPVMITQIRFDPPLPAKRRLLHQRFPSGRNTKAAIVYETPFWRERGLNGNVIATDGSLTAAFDLGGEQPTKGVLIVLFTGRAAYGVDDLGPAERRGRVLALLAQALGNQALQPIEYMDQVWANEEWSGGASSPFLVPGVLTTVRSALREPVGPLHWAGTHMATEYRGYMEGACAAGEAAAIGIAQLAGTARGRRLDPLSRACDP